MTDTKLLDSSIWLGFFFNSNQKEIIESECAILISALSLFEIKKKLILGQYANSHITKCIDYLKQRSLIIPVNENLAETAVDLSIKNKMPMADSIIYTTALEKGCEVITLDNHFRNLDNAKVMK